jgi:hypothetical protein
VVKSALSQIACDNRRAVFNGRAHKGVLGHLRDSRLKLHVHGHRPLLPFVTTDLSWDKELANNKFPISEEFRNGAIVPLGQVLVKDDLHLVFTIGGVCAASLVCGRARLGRRG